MNEQHQYKEVNIEKLYDRKLNRSLYVASNTASYSMCIEYIKHWFLSKFDDKYFKSIYVDGRHVMDIVRTQSKEENYKRLKPSLAIIPNIDFSFDNEKIDSYPSGINLYAPRGKHDMSFFSDKNKDTHIAMMMNTTLMNFTFKLRLTTKAAQIDLYKFMKMAFRVGYTQGDYIDMDCHIPYNLMLQLARDTGFYIKDEKITEIDKFISYLNRNSKLPFTYKYRCINGNSEFFVRLSDIYVHINTSDISADDGEMDGHINTNFGIEMQCAVRFPSPYFFAYYSENCSLPTENIPYDDSTSFISHDLRYVEIPEINQKRWPQYLSSEYDEKDLSQHLSIDFTELFEGDLLKIIDYTKSLNISPAIFMDIQLYSKNGLVEATMNWLTNTMTTAENPVSERTLISIYCDLEYINNTLKILKQIEETRIN